MPDDRRAVHPAPLGRDRGSGGPWPRRCSAPARRHLGISDRTWATFAAGPAGSACPARAWRPASTVTSPLRAVKDADEIAALAPPPTAADRVAAVLLDGEIPLIGRTERQVSEDIGAGLLAEGHQRVNFAIVGSGPNAASPHHDAGDRVIGPGDTVVCDFGGVRMDDVGYCSDITRTVVDRASPAPRCADCYAVLQAAQQAAVAAVAPGVTAEDVDAVARAHHRRGRLGPSTSSTAPATASASRSTRTRTSWPGNDTPLAVGHAFSVEPGIYLPGRFGMRIEDIVVVGEDGADPPQHRRPLPRGALMGQPLMAGL